MSRAGRLLLAEGTVSLAQLEDAARQQNLDGGTIGLHLVRAGAVREGTLTSIFCDHLGLQETTPEELEAVGTRMSALITPDVAVVARVVPLETLGSGWLSVAMADPTDDKTVAEVAQLTGRRLLLKVAPESEMSLTLERLYGTSRPSDLPSWTNGRESRPSAPELIAVDDESSDEFDLDEEEGSSTTSRRFRAPVVLEGRYDKISPDELPDDADAGYIPLTQVKRRPPGPSASDTVIHVNPVDIGPGQGTPPPEPVSMEPDGNPLHEEILETLQGVVPLENVKRSPSPQHGSASTSGHQPHHDGGYEPPNPFEVTADLASASTTPVPLSANGNEPSVLPSEPPEPATRPSGHPSGHPSSIPPDSWTPPPQHPHYPGERVSPKPESYAGVPGGSSWAYEDEEADGRETALDVERPPEPRRKGRRDTLMDLPKVDASHWAGEGEMPVAELVDSVKAAESRDEAIQAALSYMASYCRRSAFFVLKRGVVEGFDALGPNLSLEQVRSIWIPLSSRSTLCESVASKSIRIGPVGDSRTDAIFCAALGGRRGDSLIIPITLGSRVVSVLYGDDLRSTSPTLNQLEVVAAGLSDALARLVVREKKRSKPTS